MKWTPIVAIAGIVAIEVVALCNGVNGIALSSSLALVAGIGGYQIKSFVDKLKGGR